MNFEILYTTFLQNIPLPHFILEAEMNPKTLFKKHLLKGITLLLLICPYYMHAQLIKGGSDKGFTEKDANTFEEGEYWFELGNFKEALKNYDKLIGKFPNDEVLNYRVGVCRLQFSDQWEGALTCLLKVTNPKMQKNEYPFFLGRAYHLNLKFDEAIAEFNKYLADKKADKQLKVEAAQYLQNCEAGKKLMQSPVEVRITNLGAPVNTAASEYVPLISADEMSLAFTYRGELSIGGKQPIYDKKASEGVYFEDIMMSVKDSAGNWAPPKMLSDNINTSGNDACVALSQDANTLIMFRSIPGDIGTLYSTRFRDTTWSDPELVRGEINSPSWEGSMTVSPNGKIAYFASERPGGKGGRDIWRAHLMPDSTWGRITNAGDSLNTIYDDDAPFYHPSGEYLIIASRGHNSMGGFDIFRCDRINDTTWTKAKNIGYPINTPGEDIYYSLTSDGKKGYYSSGKAGGFGLQDIYVVEPGLPGAVINMLQVAGNITLNDKPVQADVSFNIGESGYNYINRYSNALTGRYVAALPVGENFTIIYKLKDLDPQTRSISSKDIKGFVETNIDIQFYTADYLAEMKRKKDSIEGLANAKGDKVHGDLLEEYGDAKADGLTYRVQIGAYNLAQNFNYTSVMKLSKVEKIKLDDNITRFVMGKFDSYNEAKAFREKVVAAGITDAFVTAIYKGKRVYIRELVEIGVFDND